MINTREWVNNAPKVERQKHLRLDENCVERGGNSTNHRGVLAEYLNTDIPTGPGKRIILAHACQNPNCSNPRHLYWASDAENIVEDGPVNGQYKNVWERTVAKYGYEKACEMNKRGDKSAGGRAGKGRPKSEETKRKISESLKARVVER